MPKTVVSPTGVERMLGVNELIVTKTDARGVITYANDVFLRISAYDEAAVIGQPHNLVRHPDMPRCIFKLLWDTISDGHEIFAYVVNLAGDGAHYWVFAHVTPTLGTNGKITGYHSNRRAPHAAAVAQVKAFYGELREAERRYASPREAIAESEGLLRERAGGDLQTYNEFIWALTPE